MKKMPDKKAVAFWWSIVNKIMLNENHHFLGDEVERITIACEQIIKELGQEKSIRVDGLVDAVKEGANVFAC